MTPTNVSFDFFFYLFKFQILNCLILSIIKVSIQASISLHRFKVGEKFLPSLQLGGEIRAFFLAEWGAQAALSPSRIIKRPLVYRVTRGGGGGGRRGRTRGEGGVRQECPCDQKT